MKYLISYDLRKRRSTADHKKMDDLLEDVWEAQRVMESKWVVTDTDDSPGDILRHIRGQDFFKPGDGAMVCALIEFGLIGVNGSVPASYAAFGLPSHLDIVQEL